MVEINNQAKVEVEQEKLEKVAQSFLDYYNLSGFNLSLAFLDSEEMRRINQTYRGINKTTDVLSFPASSKEKEEESFLGEILFDYEQIKTQAQREEEEELIFILIHGLLHLLGHTDETPEDKKKMIKLGEELMRNLSLK